jgi:hypothetical protein
LIHVRRECRGWVGKPVDEERRERPKSEATARRTTEKSPLPRTVTNLRAPKRADPRRRRSAHVATRDPQDQQQDLRGCYQKHSREARPHFDAEPQQPPSNFLSNARTSSMSTFGFRRRARAVASTTGTLDVTPKNSLSEPLHFRIPTSCRHPRTSYQKHAQAACPLLDSDVVHELSAPRLSRWGWPSGALTGSPSFSRFVCARVLVDDGADFDASCG